MSPWLVALATGLVVAFIQYGIREMRSGWSALPAALLRVVAIALLVALLLDAPVGRARPVTSWAALDVSTSMLRGDTALWRAARRSTQRRDRVAPHA
jgi:multisubunit Na+/H+ antiporter MnhB subunit